MLEEFDRYLNQQDRSPLTIRGYLTDLKALAFGSGKPMVKTWHLLV